MKSSACGMTAQAVLMAAAFGLSLSGPHRATAAPTTPITQNDSGVAVTILSPVPRTAFDGLKPVEISAFYQGSAGNQVINVELFVDGNKAAQKVLDAPETRGVVSFLIDSSALSSGPHRIVVRVTASDAEVASAHSTFVYEASAPEPAPPVSQPAPIRSEGAPTLSILPPGGGEENQVQGTVRLRIRATDPSGKPPYVSIFIDREFKTLRNYAPYEYNWDTTTYSNGYHTIEAFGYNDAQAVGHAQALRVLVNNPGGHTTRRTDLLDAPVKSSHPAAPLRKAAIETGRKATAIARRPAAPLLALPKATTSASAARVTRRLQMARLFALVQKSTRLMEMPALPAPFIDNAVLPASPVAPKPTVAAVQTHPAAPVRGFKPMIRSLPVDAGGALMAFTPTAHPLHVSKQSAIHIAEAALPVGDLSTEFMLSPTLPQIKATVAAHATMTVTPSKSLRVISHMPRRTPRALDVQMQRAVRDIQIHMPKLTTQVSWLQAAGQKTLLFNSSRLPLERPLTAQNSVLFGPLRQIFEQGGGSLLWQARTGVVQAHTKDKDITLTIGDKSAVINNAVVMLDGKPYLNSGRTMIPLSMLKQVMNVDIQYDQVSGHLTITSKD